MNFIKKHFKTIFVILAFGCVLWTMRHSVSDFKSLPRPSVLLLCVAAAMFMLHYLMQAIGWHNLLRSMGQHASPRVTMKMWYMSLIARWMPGRVWYTASRLMLARENGLSVAAVSFGIVMELVYILVSGVLVTFLFFGAVSKGLMNDPHVRVLFVGVGVAVLLCGSLIVQPAFLLRLYDIKFFRKLINKVAGEELDANSTPHMSVASSLGLLAYYTAFWTYSGLMFGVLASAFVPMNRERWLACIPAFPGSWLVGFFSIVTPAGLGAREGAMWLMLRGELGHAEAGVLTISSRLMMMFAELLSVAIASLVFQTAGAFKMGAPSQQRPLTVSEPTSDESLSDKTPARV